MSELIDRQAALKALRKCQTYLYDARDPELKIELSSAEAAINNLPPAQPEVLACGSGELVAQPEPTNIDAKEAVYNLAEKIGIHQLFALTVELRGEPIQPEPQEGHWIRRDCGLDVECKCSRCGYKDFVEPRDEYWFKRNYCPNCGAKMTISTK